MRASVRRPGCARAETWRIAATALAWLALASAALRALGFRRVYALLDRALPYADLRPLPHERVAALVEGIRRAARRMPAEPGCLPMALVLWAWLRCDGIPAQLKLGVRRAGSDIEAHAWVECGGRALEPRPEHFSPFPALPRAAVGAGGADP